MIIWRTMSKLIGPRRFKRFRSTSTQRKLSLKRHKGWQKEAREILKRLRSGSLSAEQTRAVLQSMSPYAFEYLITEGLKGQGADIRKLRRVSGDGGIDGMAHLNGRWHLIQAKRYAAPVSTATIEEFLQVCIEKKMPGLFVATSGFTGPARKRANQSKRLILLDGQRLSALFRA
ncbi:restriction endonuclease [Marinobacter subterrani]|uniref:restriction endonuclease n=1 Tax=Marinobacter subterrani TaxID=1658765 RepID=UPI0023549A18|nr:restriction endonuclease [Marinobacter subterrani]